MFCFQDKQPNRKINRICPDSSQQRKREEPMEIGQPCLEISKINIQISSKCHFRPARLAKKTKNKNKNKPYINYYDIK